ncbi:MAG: SpoIIE family protein phosphatase [Bacteroidetes bacterium]|nr:SpoIIE family protein phosphatase [Bacteroidota bacterium]MCA6444224.1 SpoIIE family protein phosphatase [Bacteroidota bacterium]
MLHYRLLLLVPFFLFLSYSKGQTIVQAGKEHNFTRYSVEDGLLDNNVFKVYQCSKGYIWACTPKGVSRFDGINFKNYTKKEGLSSSLVFSVCEDNNGGIWFGTGKGLCALINNKIIRFDSAFKFPQWAIRSISKFEDGTLWLSENNHIIHINPNNLKNPLIKVYKPYLKVEQVMFRDVWKNKKGELVAGCEHGCFYIKNDSLIRYNDLNTAAYQMVELPNGVEWFNAWLQPIRTYKNGAFTGNIDLGSGTLGMIKDQKNNVWIATWERGLFKYDGTKFINYSSKEGLSFNTFWGAYEDHQQNLWFSSWGNGLFKYSNECFTRITEKAGLPSNNILSAIKGLDGKIWVATDIAVSCIDPSSGKMTHFTECNGKKLVQIVKLGAHPNGNEIWCLGYLGKGYKITSNKISEVDSLAGFDVFFEKDGTAFIGTDDRGLLIQKNNDRQIYNTKFAGFARTAVLYRDSKNATWLLSQMRGICLYKNNRVEFFSAKNGFFNEGASAIKQDDKGHYWVSINNRGLYQFDFDNNKFTFLDSITVTENPLLNDVTSIIIQDKKIYLGTSKAMISYSMQHNQNWKSTLKIYGKEHGLFGIGCLLQFVDQNKHIWVITDKGLYCYQPELDLINTQETKTQINEIKLFFNKINWENYCESLNENGLPVNLKLPYHKNHLTFSFNGINLVAPSKVLYKYKLLGIENDWSPPTSKTEADYSNIPPGNYTFMVQSCNNDGLWNKTPEAFSFAITPPFWKTTWFVILCLITMILLVFWFIKSREKKLQRQNHLLEEKVQQRTFELKDALSQIEEKNKEITDSINYAKRIQSAYLPDERIFHFMFPEAFLYFKPKDIVSGDFYWFYRFKKESSDDYIKFCAVADCTGHGVPGALMSVICCNALNEVVVNNKFHNTDDILNETRKIVKQNLKSTGSGQKDGMDIALIKLDMETGDLSFSGANNPAWILQNNQLIKLKADKQPIGMHENEQAFKANQLKLTKGDKIYLFSDGYADQFGGPGGKKMKYKKLEELLLSNNKLSMHDQKIIVENFFNEWKGSLEQVDDVCVIGIKY